MSLRCLATLPHHVVLGLPALSPTMTSGNLGKWIKKEGDAVKAGERIAEVGLRGGGGGRGKGHLPKNPQISPPHTVACLCASGSPLMVTHLPVSVLCCIRLPRV